MYMHSIDLVFPSSILGIITFTIGFSFALSALGEPGHRIVQTITVLNEAIMKLVVAVMWYEPIPFPNPHIFMSLSLSLFLAGLHRLE